MVIKKEVKKRCACGNVFTGKICMPCANRFFAEHKEALGMFPYCYEIDGVLCKPRILSKERYIKLKGGYKKIHGEGKY